MLRNDIYYRLKPLIPEKLRMQVRRRIAERTRRRVSNVWPIMPASERAPLGWLGWPDGKKFALMLTHDVESRAGLEKCEELMRLEMELGFRSSFNFIPEGTYQVPNALREELVRNGFEVGVHDLNHDGRLYRSRREFSEKAEKINRYLKEWGGVGFRSGFMLSNLDWLHALEIDYDMSTFDTDPFEPQPEGRHTIFPFWVPAPTATVERGQKTEDSLRPRGAYAPAGGRKTEDGGGQNEERSDFSLSASQRFSVSKNGYVELPYTLPQDSTLFLLLGEKTGDIWTRKLDWIAEHGGMALVNVHPDYLRFGDRTTSRTYPVSLYRDLLLHVRERYEGTYWQPLPKQAAGFVRGLSCRPTVRQSKRICMISHSIYESDNRVTRYAEALVARGDHVDVIALRGSPELPPTESIQGVNLFRIQDRFGKAERSKLGYLWPLVRFLVLSSFWLTRQHGKRHYDLIHVHNVPDFLVFAAWYPKLTRTPIVLDIHDIVPEFFASKFRIEPRGLLFGLLGWMERASAAFANRVIIANDLWLEKYAARTRSTGRCSAFINNVDTTVFAPRPRQRNDGKQIILFPGGLQWHQGVDIALRAFQQVRAEVPSAEFHIYGHGNARESLVELAEELGLNGSVQFRKPLGVREIARVMADADIGVVPKRADSFGNEAYSTKIMEFMSVGVPVVVSSTKVDRFYFDDSVVRFFESGNVQALAQAILELLHGVDLRRQLAVRGSAYAARNCWENRKGDYLNLVDSLCASSASKPAQQPLETAA